MISKLYSAAVLVSCTILVSCAGNDDNSYIDKSVIPAGFDSVTAQPVVTNVNQNNLPVNTQPGNTTVVPGSANQINFNQTAGQPLNINPQSSMVTAVPQAAVPVTAPGMNPPHGQPGHRCDIAVGAPLNSKPVPVTTQAAQPAVTMTEIPNTQKTAPGMNPPHGEPGHRCDIAVGAPLNSKPAAPASVDMPAKIDSTNK